MSQVPSTHPQNLSMLAKRRIEAEILGHVYEVLKASHGKSKSACPASSPTPRGSGTSNGGRAQRAKALSPSASASSNGRDSAPLLLRNHWRPSASSSCQAP